MALITNHGYGGPDIPVGGAPDTGGQNNYVNTLAAKLEVLGYKVTILRAAASRTSTVAESDSSLSSLPTLFGTSTCLEGG